MQTFDQALLGFVMDGVISEEVAMETASSPHDFKLMLAGQGEARERDRAGRGTRALARFLVRGSGRKSDVGPGPQSRSAGGPMRQDRRRCAQTFVPQTAQPSVHPGEGVAAACSERGLAVPTSLLVLVVSFGFATVALVASTQSQSGGVRDQDQKAAIAAADAGAEQAILRENKIETTDEGTCLVPGAGGTLAPGAALADGWCPEISAAVGDASYAYRVSPWELVTVSGQERRAIGLVSRGDSDLVSRRIAISATAPTGVDILGLNRAVGVDGVSIGGTSLVNVSTGSDQSVVVEENGTLCGDARHGPEGDFSLENNGDQCPGYTNSEGLVPMPPVDVSELYANNDNAKLLPGLPQSDQRSGSVVFDPATRTLTLSGAEALTLGKQLPDLPAGHVRLQHLIMAAGATSRLYFDSPENCGLAGQPEPIEQVTVIGTSKILSTSYNPEAGAFDLLGMYMVGSAEIETQARFQGTANVGQEFLLYAPRTRVLIGGTAEYVGPIVGKTLETFGTALLTSDANLLNPDVDVIIIYKRDRYVECTGGASTIPPDSSC